MIPKRFKLRLILFLLTISCFAACDDNQSTPEKTDVTIDASFDSGNMETARYLGDGRFLVRPRPDIGRDIAGEAGYDETTWNGRTWWYHFAVTVPEEQLPYPIELMIDATRVWMDKIYGPDKVPVVSCDGTNWRFASGWSEGAGNPVISETLTCPTTYVAMATPYPWFRMETFIESIFTNPYIIQQDIIGRTPTGENEDDLPLYYLLLSDSGDLADKRNVIITSGQHPGETANSWMLTGLIEFLLSDDPLAQRLRQAFAFHIYPAVNPEGVKYGHFRRTADSPLNPNRAWASDEVTEVKIVREHILLQTNGRADYLFDLHSSRAPIHFIYHSEENEAAGDWVNAVAARHPHVTADRGQRPNTGDRGIAWRWAMGALRSHGDELEPPISATPEASYAHGSWEDKPDQTADWKAFGAALVQAIGDTEGIVAGE